MGLYVSLCGNIGAGKTSLARLIAQTWQWRHFEEQVDDHPFLADFYQDRARWALASQLVFLERSFRQQYEITQQSLDAVQERSSHENFTIFVRTLHAQGTLSDAEFGVIRDLFALFDRLVKRPDLLIYLRADDSTLLRRIAIRARASEIGHIDRSYIAALNAAYETFYADYPGTKTIIDVSDLDFVHEGRDAERILARVDAAVAKTRATDVSGVGR